MTHRKLHYAWIVVAITFLVLLVAGGVRTAPPVLIKPLEQEFGWTRANISFAIAVSILWFGLGGPLAGILVNRFGLRRMMTGGLILVAMGLSAMLKINTLWQLHLFWGVLVGIGTGALANVLGAIVAQRWFNQHRGLIVGVMGAASAAGQLIFLPTMIALTTWGGWRGAILIIAVAVAGVVIPVVWLMREFPRDKGLNPYCDTDTPTTLAEVADAARQTSLAEAARTTDFWLLAASFFVCGYTTNGLIGTHLLPHAIEHGFDSASTANAIVLMGLMNIVGTLASGWFSDRYDNRMLLAVYYSFRAASIAFLPFISDMSGLFIFAFVYGLDWIATVPPTINLTAQRFGRASVGVLYGWIFFSHMLGAAVAAYIGGVLRDLLGDYTVAFFSAAVLGFIAAGFSMTIKRMHPVMAEG
ncbi:MAG TPA: MFS transporter [Anaerolineales bacterium]|nr:MFS transporter [Anaerolineales bacterium]